MKIAILIVLIPTVQLPQYSNIIYLLGFGNQSQPLILSNPPVFSRNPDNYVVEASNNYLEEASNNQ